MFDYTIKGSGFKAVYMALKLRKKYPKASISINTKNLGGIYTSIKHDGYYLDIGCHLFDSNDKRFLNIFEINQNKMVFVDNNYASINNNGLTENYAIYDFRNHKNYNKIKQSFLENFSKIREISSLNSLYDYYFFRYGEEVTKIIDSFCVDFTGFSSKDIDSRSRGAFPFRRLLMFDNKHSLKLKKEGYEDFLAAESKYVHDYSKNHIAFTFKNGNSGFISHVKSILENKNIKILESVNSTTISIEIDNSKDGFEQIKIPLHLIYFITEKFPYDYLTDYSNSPVFRISAAGHYSRQFLNKKSYVCVEITDPNQQYTKNDCVEFAEQYLMRYCKPEYLHYLYFKNSYPVFKFTKKNIKSNTVNFFNYTKSSIMDNIDHIVEQL